MTVLVPTPHTIGKKNKKEEKARHEQLAVKTESKLCGALSSKLLGISRYAAYKKPRDSRCECRERKDYTKTNER